MPPRLEWIVDDETVTSQPVSVAFIDVARRNPRSVVKMSELAARAIRILGLTRRNQDDFARSRKSPACLAARSVP